MFNFEMCNKLIVMKWMSMFNFDISAEDIVVLAGFVLDELLDLLAVNLGILCGGKVWVIHYWIANVSHNFWAF